MSRSPPCDPRELVVTVHGLYMGPWAMSLLGRRLRRFGLCARGFAYASLRTDLEACARQLNTFLADLDGDTIHLVGHSLGGLVLRQLLHRYPRQRPGRLVTLGTPHQGSAVARRMYRSPWLRPGIGRALRPGLLGGMPAWDGARELGVIAGTGGLGLGRLIPGLGSPNDGTVSLAETWLDKRTEHIALPATHTGLLLSARAAQLTGAFLRHGHFPRPPR